MKYIKYIAVFLLLLYGGQWLISVFLNSLLKRSSFRYSKVFLSQEKMDYQVLCIGNSRGLNAFYSPYVNDKYSVQSYNLSYNGLDVAITADIIKTYLEKHQNPQHLFIEISSVLETSGEQDYNQFNLYASSSKHIYGHIKDCNKSLHWTSTILPLYRYNTEMLYRSLYYSLKNTDQNWINNNEVSSSIIDKIDEIDSVNLVIDTSDLIEMKSLLTELNNTDIQVHLFMAPYLPKYKKKIENLESILDQIQIGLDHPIQDLTDAIPQLEYFADRIHNNKKGSKIVSDLLMHNILYKKN